MKREPELISVTYLREHTREVLENACFKGKCYQVERAGQPMVVIVGVEEYGRIMAGFPDDHPQFGKMK